MATTWDGWQAQMLTASPGLVTPPNITFMSEWHKHAPGSCDLNPVDLSTAVSGSSRCGDTVAGFGRTQKYGTHAQAVRAFRLQMDDPQSAAIKAALNTGNPFQIADRTAAVAAIRKWGSPSFADWYATATGAGTSGGGSSGGSETGLHKGWADFQKTAKHTLPGHVQASEKMTAAALRKLAQARKVLR